MPSFIGRPEREYICITKLMFLFGRWAYLERFTIFKIKMNNFWVISINLLHCFIIALPMNLNNRFEDLHILCCSILLIICLILETFAKFMNFRRNIIF